MNYRFNIKLDVYKGTWHLSPLGSLISDIHGVSRPKFSKVDRSTPGAGPKYREPLDTFVTVGPFDLQI